MNFSKEKDCVTRSIGEHTIIVPLRSEVADLESVYSLNGCGSRMWHLLDSATSLDVLVDDLCREYDVEEAKAREDVEAFVDKLSGFGLLKLESI